VRPKLSIIVPFYNEEENIGRMHAALVDAVAHIGVSYELVFVDDGSADQTFLIAARIAERDPHVRVVKFRRNYGQTPAMAAGIQAARGEVLITMDGDLQNDPRDIPLFLEKIAEGYDIVVGWRFNRQDKLVTRKIPSRIANWLIGRVTGVPIRDNGCSLKAFRGDLIKQIPLYSEMHRFIPAMASIAGPRIAEIKVRHHARAFGKSKYGLSRIYKVLLDLLIIKTLAGFAARPLLWFSLLALPFTLAGILLLAVALSDLLQGGRTTIAIAGTGVIFLMSSIILWSGGAVAELVFKTGNIRDRAYVLLPQSSAKRRPPRPMDGDA
jgi:glycosyltransferase involved in cell wall biosynthesis